MPQDVIDCVHSLARRSYANQGLTFAWRTEEEMPNALDDIDDDSDDEHAYIYNSDDDDDDENTHDDDLNGPDPLDLPVAGALSNAGTSPGMK